MTTYRSRAPDVINYPLDLGVLLTRSDLLLLLLLLLGILGLAGVKLVALGIELLIIVGLPGVQLVSISIQLLLIVASGARNGCCGSGVPTRPEESVRGARCW